MRKIFFAIILTTVLFFAPFVRAQDFSDAAAQTENADNFKAKIIKIEQEAEKNREDGSKFKQQNLQFTITSGNREGEIATYYGISEIEVGDANIYKVGDKVYIDAFKDETGQETFYIVDYIRNDALYLLGAIFILSVIIIGRWKGIKALLSLVASFFVIIKFILPQILAGHDPFIISLIGGLMIMFFIIYFTEGFNRKSHIAIFSVLVSLIITLILSILFTDLARLTGLTQEESIFLIGIGQKEINFRGLLLAGMIIGAIGVLDDIILGQIEAVDSIKQANPKLPPKKVFKLAYKVGNTHLGAIINTLFLTYAGAALPLLLLFSINQANGLSLSRALNAEVISTEIIRTLVGSIGVMASMPIATFLASINMNFKLNWKKGFNIKGATTHEKK
jgi:uncharacterized membrane protein